MAMSEGDSTKTSLAGADAGAGGKNGSNPDQKFRIGVPLVGGRELLVDLVDGQGDFRLITAAQRGKITMGQLLAVGVTRAKVRTLVRSGALRREHRRVFGVVGGSEPVLGRETAALLALGPRGLLIGPAALVAFGVIPPDEDRPIDATVTEGAIKSRPGIRAHTLKLEPEDIRTFNGLRVTTVERALYDSIGYLTLAQLQEAADEAVAARHTSRTKLQQAAKRYAGRPRGPAMAVIAGQQRQNVSKSVYQRKLLTLLREAGLVELETEVTVCGHQVDFYDRKSNTVIEVDSFGFHGEKRSKFQRDRAKARTLRANGIELISVTPEDIDKRPLQVVADIVGTIRERAAVRFAVRTRAA